MIQRSTLNIQRSMERLSGLNIGRWALGVGRWAFAERSA